MVVLGDRGSRANEQPRRANLANGRALEEERFRLPERIGLPVCGANPDGGSNAAIAEAIGAGLPGRIRDRPPLRSYGTSISDAVGGLNGYQAELRQS